MVEHTLSLEREEAQFDLQDIRLMNTDVHTLLKVTSYQEELCFRVYHNQGRSIEYIDCNFTALFEKEIFTFVMNQDHLCLLVAY